MRLHFFIWHQGATGKELTACGREWYTVQTTARPSQVSCKACMPRIAEHTTKDAAVQKAKKAKRMKKNLLEDKS